MPAVRFGSPADMADWLRRLADLVATANGQVMVRVIRIDYESADVTRWGETTRHYAHTGRWTATLEIEGAEGFRPPDVAALPPMKLSG